jgi:hypothetical protein
LLFGRSIPKLIRYLSLLLASPDPPLTQTDRRQNSGSTYDICAMFS